MPTVLIFHSFVSLYRLNRRAKTAVSFNNPPLPFFFPVPSFHPLISFTSPINPLLPPISLIEKKLTRAKNSIHEWDETTRTERSIFGTVDIGDSRGLIMEQHNHTSIQHSLFPSLPLTFPVLLPLRIQQAPSQASLGRRTQEVLGEVFLSLILLSFHVFIIFICFCI